MSVVNVYVNAETPYAASVTTTAATKYLPVNATGYAAPFLTALRATAPGGEVSTLGGARHGAQGELADIFKEIHYRHLVVRGGWELRLPLRSAPASRVASTESNLGNGRRVYARVY